MTLTRLTATHPVHLGPDTDPTAVAEVARTDAAGWQTAHQLTDPLVDLVVDVDRLRWDPAGSCWQVDLVLHTTALVPAAGGVR